MRVWGEGLEGVEESVAALNGHERGLDLGGEHTVQCVHDVLRNCAPETCIILLPSVTPINSIKKKKEKYRLVITNL